MPETIRIGQIELRFLRDKHDTNGSLDLFEMTVPSGGRMPVAHYHRDWDETVYGLTGTFTFTIEGTPHPIAAGTVLFIPRGTVHGFDNTSGKTATCLTVLTPGVLGPEYFRELSALVSGGPPDEAKMREVMLRHGLIPA
jgi:quercetin dioxygenase-like cupin family protein